MVLVGYKTFFSKNKGCDYFVLNLEYPFKDGQGVGKEVYQQFVTEEVYNMVKPDMLGKTIEFDEVREGKYTTIVRVSAKIK